MKKDAARRLSGHVQGALRIPSTKKLAKGIRGRPHSVWLAFPQLTPEKPHESSNLIAVAATSGRATEEIWNPPQSLQAKLMRGSETN